MSLRTKTILALLAGLAVLIAILDGALVFSIRRSFGELETSQAKARAAQGTAVINRTVAQVKRSIGDWAVWDDAYKYVQDHNKAFEDSNFANSTIVGMRLNFMAFYDANGRLVGEKAANSETMADEKVPQDVSSLFKSDSRFFNLKTPDSSFEGIVLTSKGPMAFCAHAISNTAANAKPAGVLIFGRYLTDTVIKELSKDYNLSMQLCRLDSSELPDDVVQSRETLSAGKGSCAIIPLSNTSIASYSFIKDINNKSAMILRVDAEREIYSRSMTMVSYTNIGLIAAGLLFACLTVIWLDITVLRRITRLDVYVKGVMAELGLG